ncbi:MULTISPECIES: transposase [Mesorhizobium]|uniref:Transposase n=1 Tax=Mesorhizobium erdmanii TaxID=1777866 RepID=A0A6M7UPI3_9HYPH|nr:MULTISPECIES: transposase [Mesorhizobium]QKC79171.1 transposase [Mesorhizobium erdmanii]
MRNGRGKPFLPGAAKTGRRVVTDLREVLNAFRYMARSDGGWRMLSKDFPPISVAVETPYGRAHGLRELAGTSPRLTAKQQAPIKALNAEYAKTRSRGRACQRTAGRC